VGEHLAKHDDILKFIKDILKVTDDMVGSGSWKNLKKLVNKS
jgi:hypothetical protein